MADGKSSEAACADQSAGAMIDTSGARLQTLGDMLRRSARRAPDVLALSYQGDEWTYAQLDRNIDALAAGLQAEGVAHGDRVAILSRNSHWFVLLRFALARLGAVVVPINFMLNVDDVSFILEHSQSKMAFIDASCLAIGLAAARQAGLARCYMFPDAEDQALDTHGRLSDLIIEGTAPAPGQTVHGHEIAQIIYTSGTESRPKGAMLSHDAILWQYQSCVADCGWTGAARVLNALPLFHCAQLDAFLGPSLQVTARNYIIRAPAPEEVIPLIEKLKITSFFAPPTVWIALLRSPMFDRHDLSSLTHGYYGASIMPVEVLRELRERLPGMRLWNCYGQTEIAPVAAVLQPEDQERKAGAAGRPTLHVETRIVDDDMRDVEIGEVGEIVHRSPQLMTGYWRDPERTAEAFAGGWFHSGDLATIDAEGFITIVDRKKDMIKTGGENVSSREVEEHIYRLGGISEVAVVGLPHPTGIEAVTAFVVLRDGEAVREDEISAHCAAGLTGFKVPKQIVIVDSLPRNASGKILKKDLRTVTA